MITTKNSERETALKGHNIAQSAIDKILHSPQNFRSSHGFTLVELIIVIVVIGVLAAIILVAYGGVTKGAQISAMTSEMKQWKELFETYKAVNGHYPAPSATPLTGGGPGSSALNVYCLGTGFPNSDCYGNPTTPAATAESTGTQLMTELSTIAKPPTNSTKYPTPSATGPWLVYLSDTDVRMSDAFPGGTTCPGGMTAGYNGPRQDCYYKLDYSQ